MNQTSANLSYLWHVPGKPVSVNMTLDAIDRMGFAVEEGLQLLPRRGLETGGVLLGRSRRDGEGLVVDIEDFEEVECEHAAGPSYLCSASDRKRLEERIRRHKSAAGLSIVGFYRSHTRKEFALTVEDVNLMSDYFAKPSNVFLLIHVHAGSTPTAGFVIWEGREIRSLVPLLEFPFGSAALRKRGLEIPSPAPASAPAPIRPKVKPPAPVPAPPVAAAIAKPAPPPVPPRAPELPAPSTAEPYQWKPALAKALAPVLRQPRRRLEIAGLATVVLLVAAGLARMPRSAGGAVTPTPVRKSTPAPGIAAAAPTPVEPPPTTALPREAAPVAPPPAVPAEVAEATTAPALPEEPKEIASHRDRVTPKPTRDAAPELIPTEPTPAEPEMPEPPAVAGAAALNPRLSLSSDILRTPVPTAPDTFVRVTVDTTGASKGHGLFGRLSGNKSSFVPPKPIRQASTDVPADLRNRITRETPVDVKVYIDRTGKVEYAELLSSSSSVDRQLASLAVFSSRRWQFSPAQSGDERVPAEVVLRFRFGPDK